MTAGEIAPGITLVVPYYRNPLMLAHQARLWALYPGALRVIVIDDGSPEPALDALPSGCRAAVWRIDVDIPWNRNGARNLGAHVAETEWLLMIDIDHVLPVDDARRLVARPLDPLRWYRFRRFRVGRADETRRKDALDPESAFGEIKPHIDSYLCHRALYWSVGGYDEDYSGSLGGSAPFLKKLAAAAPCEVLKDLALHVHTRDSVPDASDLHLSRDRSRYERLRREKAKAGDPTPVNPLRFSWHRAK